MKKNLILEIGVEDLPPYCGEYLNLEFRPLFEKKLMEERISYEILKIYYTPRRILIFLKDLQEKQDEKVSEIYGPPLEICLDKNGNWTDVAEKFAKSYKITLKELKIFEKKGRKVVGFVKREEGKHIKEIFNSIINDVLKKLEIPRGMIWNAGLFKFFRPIRYITCIYGKELIPMEIGGVKSGKYTYGHRILSDKKIKILNTKDYFDKILKNFVIFDPEVREKMIKGQIGKMKKGDYSFNEELLKKIVPLVEYPVCGNCSLPEKYKELPREIVESIILNVKGIPLQDKNGNLSQDFIVVCDGVFNEKIKENYEKVVENKIEDALFFIQQDMKKPFIEYLNDLRNIVYHPRLGTIYDRVERIRKICEYLCNELKIGFEKINLIISLCKNDLATLLANEFPELQGVVGKIYAEKNGYDEIISKSIEQIYWPRFYGDRKPEFIESAVISVCDRIETLCSLISEGAEVKGDQDPLGIKRITTGMIEIIWDKKMEFPISKLVEKTLEILGRVKEETKNLIIDFIFQRAENLLVSEGIKPGLRKAIFSVKTDNLTEIRKKIDALKEIFTKGKGEEILIPFIRVANMLKQAENKKIEYGVFSENLLVEETEKELYKFYNENKEKMEKYYVEGKYIEFLEEMSKWKIPIDKFFDNVFVMVDDEKIRNNRLSLLRMINEIFIKFADFSQIPMTEVENVKKI
ncbi:MAG: glycine--tRNA ligase subunit beta [Candidatus Omnitrophica bacterium]|nr:glycine--tRNA ligase subunit beta [Candidatus Omnitrophota bacterium]